MLLELIEEAFELSQAFLHHAILEEIHKYREEYAKSFQYDLRAIFNDLKQKQAVHKDSLVRLPIKRESNKSTAPKQI